VVMTPQEHAGFCANAIALAPGSVWMGARAARVLSGSSRAGLAAAGFSVRSVPLEAIEAGGGSLRCCVAEVF
jgi:N-dimethylarginine dimethylaminohydrolase